VIESLMVRLIKFYAIHKTATQNRANEAIHAWRYGPDIIYSAWYALEHGDQNGYKWIQRIPRTDKRQKALFQINPHLETDDSALERAGLLAPKPLKKSL
jgi:hypothetical protein